jgi:hypothetical protein
MITQQFPAYFSVSFRARFKWRRAAHWGLICIGNMLYPNGPSAKAETVNRINSEYASLRHFNAFNHIGVLVLTSFPSFDYYYCSSECY